MDRLERIKKEIERLREFRQKIFITEDEDVAWNAGNNFALTSIEILLDSMQEEPKEFKPVRKKQPEGVLKELLDNMDEKELEDTRKEMLKEEPVSEDFDKEEYQKCCDSPAYFFNNYVLVKDSNGNWVKPNPVTDEQITEVAEKAHREEWKRRDSMRCEMAKTIMKLFPEVFKGKILLSSRIKEK